MKPENQEKMQEKTSLFGQGDLKREMYAPRSSMRGLLLKWIQLHLLENLQILNPSLQFSRKGNWPRNPS